MFEAVSSAPKISRQELDARDQSLHTALLQAQRALRERDFSVLILVSGVEGAGKGEVVQALHRWFDPRGLETYAFWDESDEERLRPRFWRFWRALPARGRIGILFGSWYTEPIVKRALKETGSNAFDRELERIRHFEDTLVDDGTLIIKLWFHLDKNDQIKRLNEDARSPKKRKKHSVRHLSPLARRYAKHYDRFLNVSQRALRRTDVAHSPWHLVAAANPDHRNLSAGETILNRMRERLDQARPSSGRVTTISPAMFKPGDRSVLSNLPTDIALDAEAYKTSLREQQTRLAGLSWKAYRRGINTVAVFEGWDAAGKGGAIRRVTQSMDPRLYRVISIAAPTEEEAAHHYLWRFWRQLPRAGYHTIYDRSWYGRVLVERVEGFADDIEWQRGYYEINAFEEQLVENGTVVLKFWLNITPEEQLTRFTDRQQDPRKQHKITDEDWRNRERWPDYEAAVNDMITHTSTEIAPWQLVAANDKRHARVEVLTRYADAIEAALKRQKRAQRKA